jgi:uncharacterized ion transporter superfamily protein YfcC
MRACEFFIKGLEAMIVPALIVGVARGISIVMQESQIMDTILFSFSSALSVLPKSIAAVGMLIFSIIFEFLYSFGIWASLGLNAINDTAIGSN